MSSYAGVQMVSFIYLFHSIIKSFCHICFEQIETAPWQLPKNLAFSVQTFCIKLKQNKCRPLWHQGRVHNQWHNIQSVLIISESHSEPWMLGAGHPSADASHGYRDSSQSCKVYPAGHRCACMSGNVFGSFKPSNTQISPITRSLEPFAKSKPTSNEYFGIHWKIESSVPSLLNKCHGNLPWVHMQCFCLAHLKWKRVNCHVHKYDSRPSLDSQTQIRMAWFAEPNVTCCAWWN